MDFQEAIGRSRFFHDLEALPPPPLPYLNTRTDNLKVNNMRQNNLISPTNNKLQDDGVSGGLVSSVEDQSDVKTLPSSYNQVRVLVFVGVVSATILVLVQVDVPSCQLCG